MEDSCAHTPLMYSSARAEFCADKSSSFCLETDFGRLLSALFDDDDDDGKSSSVEVVVLEEDSSIRSIPSMAELEVVGEEAAELARFMRNDLQSPKESSSM